jgi:hypothetical protein
VNLAHGCFVLCLLTACANAHLANVEPGHPALVVEHHIAEGKGEGSDLPANPNGKAPSPPPASSASPAPSSPPPPPLSGSQPDPEPLVMKEQWEYQVLFSNGSASVEGVVKRSLPKPVPTARRMGRFALELWIGHELIDRVRFDFPMIAAEGSAGNPRRPLHAAPELSPHATARVRVSLPASPRATRLMLVDRATEKAQELPWPPDRDGPVTPPAQVPNPSADPPTLPRP